MARNRRRVDGELTFSWFIAKLLVFGLGVGLVLGLTFVHRQNFRMGEELRVLDHELQLAQEKTAGLEVQLAHLRTPRELQARMERFNLNMARPTEEQMRRFHEPEELDSGVIAPRIVVQANPIRTSLRNP
jgi:hypothetical protein